MAERAYTSRTVIYAWMTGCIFGMCVTSFLWVMFR